MHKLLRDIQSNPIEAGVLLFILISLAVVLVLILIEFLRNRRVIKRNKKEIDRDIRDRKKITWYRDYKESHFN